MTYKKDTQTEERNRDLFEAYKRVIQRHGKYARVMKKKDLYQETVDEAAPRFYISAEEAGRIIAKMFKNEKHEKPQKLGI